MAINYIDGPGLIRVIMAGSQRVAAKRVHLNEINVFPVPDRDTGTNLTLTLKAAADAVRDVRDHPLSEVASAISSAVLLGARGNAGIIFAQLLRGMAREMTGVDRIYARGFATAFRESVRCAHEAMSEPTEGTILTVVRETSEEVDRLVEGGETDFDVLLRAMRVRANESLARTPELLPVLKEAGVVDAGGEGFVDFLEGVQMLLDGEDVGDALGSALFAGPTDAGDGTGVTFRSGVWCTRAHRVRIVTDSTADLPGDLADELGVTVVPLTVCFGLETFRDGVDISHAEFYERLSRGGELPTTTQPSPEAFSSAYERLSSETGVVLSIHVSSTFSGTFQSAQSAADRVTGLDVAVVDSHHVCVPLGLIVIELARAAEQGMGLVDLVSLAESLRSRARVLFSVGSLDNLVRGGRIGRAQALVGKVAHVRPILTVEGGVVAVAGKAFGEAGAMQWVADFAGRELDGAAEGPLGIVHAGRPDVVDWASGVFRTRFGFTEVVPFELGATVGAHTGPGTWGVSYLRSH